MTGLQKFIEQGPYGEKSGGVAYAFKLSSLPQPNEGMDWQIARSFNVADELLNDAGLKDVFKVAIDKGCAVVNELGLRGRKRISEARRVSKNRKVRWTPEEDDLLRKRVVANVPVSEIAAELGRSISSVRARAHVLRIALGRYILK